MRANRFICSALIILAGLVAGSASAVLIAPPTTQILVLSNRADLISGNDALVEIIWPKGASIAAAKIAVNGRSVVGSFAMRANGRYMGLVTGLAVGPNVLTARVPGSGAQITINNHPIGGPVFAGAQLQPWICATKPANPAVPNVGKVVTVTGNPGSTPLTANATTKVSGLNDDPSDTQCNTPPTYTYFYQPIVKQGSGCTFTITGANPCFTQYPVIGDPATRPANSAIADFTNDGGVTVKSLIRIERGSINRTIYQLATFYDPLDANVPWAPPKGWNGKLVWKFGPSAAVSRFEQTPARQGEVVDDNMISRGFMVATSSLTDHGTNSNDTLAAETVMMTKELIIEKYGQIRYTIGDGCSGGSIMQHSIASAYPGLIDGIQPTCSFQDTFTTFIEIADCGALGLKAEGSLPNLDYYGTAPASNLNSVQRNAINGHKLTGGSLGTTGFCLAWISQFLPAGDPTRAANCGSGFPSALVYTRTATNPKGIRCDGTDHDVGMVGTFVDPFDGRTKANPPNDNVGLQYGLKALQARTIAPEDFVNLNEGVGGYNADLTWISGVRMKADANVLHTYYSGGLVSDGRQLAKVPIIDLRGNESPAGDIHSNWRPWGLRDRLDRDHGGHDNQVIYAYDSNGGAAAVPASLTLKAFLDMDAWLHAIETDSSANPIEVKVVNNKPAGATDLCQLTNGSMIGLTDPACPVKFEASPRQAAGGPRAENIFKCQLKLLDFSDPDFAGVTFTSDQQSRLNNVFPDGVCDWSQFGVGQVPVNPWTTFAGGPGGVPLPAPPVSGLIP